MALTNDEAGVLNNMNPSAQKTDLGTEIKDNQTLDAAQMVVVRFDITADATSGLSVTIPYSFYLTDVVVQCTAASGSGTVTLRNSTTAITDAIVCAVDHVVTRAGTIDNAHADILTTDSINVITNGSADRGTVYLYGIQI